jgi:hypothetical protein
MTATESTIAARARRTRRPRALARLVCLAGIGGAQAANISVGPATDPGCQYNTMQAAINAAAAAPGLDVIRISIGTYDGQRVMVNEAGPLAIQGGFLSCSTPVANAGTTTLNGQGGGPPGFAVINHVGAGALTLLDLTITGGQGASGGGVQSSGLAPLNMTRVLVHGNRATVGAGLSVVGVSGAGLKPVNLTGVRFVDNIASSSGGGIYALAAEVRIGGDEANWFAGNWAQGASGSLGGGAIYAFNSNILVHSLAPGDFPFMDANLAAQGAGGAILLYSTTGYHSLVLMNKDATRPLVIANNAASKGGAIRLLSGGGTVPSSAIANLHNTIVRDNDASEGGAFFIEGNDTTHLATSHLTMLQSGVGYAAPPCPASLRCNRLEGNFSSLTSTVSVYSYSGQGRGLFAMLRGHAIDNFSPNSGIAGGIGSIWFDSSVIANNVVGSSLMSNVAAPILVQNSTIAGNTIGAAEVFSVILAPGSLTVENSIVYQPGKQTRLLAPPATSNLRNLLVNPDHGIANIAGLNIQGNLMPSFVNPGQNDFQLQPGSQARNRWSPGGGVSVPTIDLLGGTRPADPPGTPTPYDFGAYEYGAVIDAMFMGNFDG